MEAVGFNLATKIGLGETFDMILVVPIILLYSYSRKVKFNLSNTLIPIAGAAIIGFLYFDGFISALQVLIAKFSDLSSGLLEILGINSPSQSQVNHRDGSTVEINIIR